MSFSLPGNGRLCGRYCAEIVRAEYRLRVTTGKKKKKNCTFLLIARSARRVYNAHLQSFVGVYVIIAKRMVTYTLADKVIATTRQISTTKRLLRPLSWTYCTLSKFAQSLRVRYYSH